MTRIVTTIYRYKRPPRKRKPVALDVPAIVAKRSRRPFQEGQAAAELLSQTSPKARNEAAQSVVRPTANDERKPAIVTGKRKSRFGDVPDLAPEELQRRGDAADALWRELVRRTTAKGRP